jgi:LPPG:FO 2-phospho-L-lactate transferase
MFERYGEETWFTVGDSDLATHIHRTRLVREGASLTDATAGMASALGIGPRILPASDDAWRTVIRTDEGTLAFQDYFVRRRQGPDVRGVDFAGAGQPAPAVLTALAEADVVVIGPSNPIVSIGPILALPGIRSIVQQSSLPRVAVSPIVAGQALKGPADRMLASLGHEVSAVGVATIYAGLVDAFVIDEADATLAPAVEALGMRPVVLPTVMRRDADRVTLAAAIVEAAT